MGSQEDLKSATFTDSQSDEEIGKNYIKEAEELRKKLGKDEFVQQQLSLLVPGIENSEQRFHVHQFTRSVMMLPDFKDYHKLDPFIQALVNELSPYDFLGCSAALEILADIASGRRENIRHFEQIGLLSKVYDLFTFTKQSPDLGLIHIACIRFFGYLTTADPEALLKYPLFTADVFDAVYRFDAFDPKRRKLAFETFAIITTTSGAKQFLTSKECPYNVDKAMNHLGAAVATGAQMPELKACYLLAVKTIFDSFDPEKPEESDVVLRHWFDQLGDPFPRLLFHCLKMPFAEVQIASIEALLALMRHRWAPPKFCSLDGFLNFLVNRQTNLSFVGHQLKYDLVCRLLSSASPAIDAVSMQKLGDYRVEGAFAPPEKVAVATEDA